MQYIVKLANGCDLYVDADSKAEAWMNAKEFCRGFSMESFSPVSISSEEPGQQEEQQEEQERGYSLVLPTGEIMENGFNG